MKNNQNKLSEKLEKLLALSNDKRGNPHEANLAKKMALNLLKKNGFKINEESEVPESEIILRQRWISNLIKHPQLAKSCNIWDKFGTWDWTYLLEKQPQFANRCPCFNKFDHSQWRFIIVSQISLAKYCKTWTIFNEWDWTRILRAHPELIKFKNPSLE